MTRGMNPIEKKSLFRITLWGLALAVALPWTARAQTPIAPTDGDGLTTGTAYQLSALGHLVWLGQQAQAGQTDGRYYKLTSDIDATPTANWNDEGTSTDVLEGFVPIGDDAAPFEGVFLGEGHTIRGLHINREATDTVGLFGSTAAQSVLSDVTLLETNIRAGLWYVGALVGRNRGRVSRCSVIGTVTCPQEGYCLGGLVGQNFSGTLDGCSVQCTVSGSAYSVAGLLGDNLFGRVEDCESCGSVTNSIQGIYLYSTGGLVGGGITAPF